ncbi:MAG: hypothetical protein ACXAAH_17880 [Promethearchaeota archaeon]|jgi:hypothetical protein
MPALAHIGIGFAAKRFFPNLPLWSLLISVMAIDLLVSIFFFATWITHGLFMSVIWSIVAMLITALITMYQNSKIEQSGTRKSINLNMVNIKNTFVIGLLVFSHWVLDFIGWPMSAIDPNATGVPLIFDDAVNIGLGVYSTWTGALLMDIGVFVIGLGLYVYYLKKVKK